MNDRVGPILERGDVADAIIAAIRHGHTDMLVEDRGSYLRVSCPRRCSVTRSAIEAALGRSFRLPGDLECVMPSFRGEFHVNEEEAAWILPEGGVQP